MSGKEINIKSSTIEKGLELAKEFLGKLISPTVEEIGLLISDNVRYLRYKNQIGILLKAKDYVEKRNIKVKEIPIKILVPLLDKASLEDNEEIQDKWAKMLTNMVDSEYNLQNQIFPHILSQISIEEFNELKVLQSQEKEYLQKIEEYANEKTKVTNSDSMPDMRTSYQKMWKMEKEMDNIEQGGFWIELEEFERANLLRLGLIKQLPPRIFVDEITTDGREYEQRHKITAQYDAENYGYRMTELGERFISICELKSPNK